MKSLSSVRDDEETSVMVDDEMMRNRVMIMRRMIFQTNTVEESSHEKYVGMSVSGLVNNTSAPIDEASLSEKFVGEIQPEKGGTLSMDDEDPGVSSMVLGDNTEIQEVVTEYKHRCGYCLTVDISQ